MLIQISNDLIVDYYGNVHSNLKVLLDHDKENCIFSDMVLRIDEVYIDLGN